MAYSPFLADILTRHQVYLERLKRGEVNTFNKVIREIDKAIGQTMAALGDQQLSEMSKAQLRRVMRELREAHEAAMERAVDNLIVRLQKLAAYETEFEAKAINTAAPAAGALSLSAASAYAAAAERPLSATGELLEPFLRTMTKREVAAVNMVLSRASVNGWTNAQTVQVLRGTKRNNYRDGLLMKMGQHNEAIVRTSMQHVSSVAAAETWALNADIIKAYRWTSTLDSRTTETCRSLDGQEFELGAGPLPPIHINCRSRTVPILVDKLNVLSKGRKRASADGPVDANETYYSWLKRQPAAFQDSVLGPSRGTLFRDGGLSAEEFARISIGRDYQPLTLDEMRRLEPNAFERAGL